MENLLNSSIENKQLVLLQRHFENIDVAKNYRMKIPSTIHGVTAAAIGLFLTRGESLHNLVGHLSLALIIVLANFYGYQLFKEACNLYDMLSDRIIDLMKKLSMDSSDFHPIAQPLDNKSLRSDELAYKIKQSFLVVPVAALAILLASYCSTIGFKLT